MSFEIVQVLGSITFRNADVTMIDTSMVSDSEDFINSQTDNKTYYIPDPVGNDWRYNVAETTSTELINKLNSNNINDLNIIQNFECDDSLAVIDTKAHPIVDNCEKEFPQFKSWSGTVYFLFVNDELTGESMMVIAGVPKKGSKHFVAWDGDCFMTDD